MKAKTQAAFLVLLMPVLASAAERTLTGLPARMAGGRLYVFLFLVLAAVLGSTQSVLPKSIAFVAGACSAVVGTSTTGSVSDCFWALCCGFLAASVHPSATRWLPLMCGGASAVLLHSWLPMAEAYLETGGAVGAIAAPLLNWLGIATYPAADGIHVLTRSGDAIRIALGWSQLGAREALAFAS